MIGDVVGVDGSVDCCRVRLKTVDASWRVGGAKRLARPCVGTKGAVECDGGAHEAAPVMRACSLGARGLHHLDGLLNDVLV